MSEFASNYIKRELIRAKHWKNLEANLVALKIKKSDNTCLLYKDIHRMLVRYVMIQMIDMKSNDDPVFIVGVSDKAMRQVVDDYKYMSVVSPVEKFVGVVEEHFGKAVEELKDVGQDEGYDRLLEYNEEIREIKYRNLKWKVPIGVKLTREKLPLVGALIIRYEYLSIGTYGLANDYKTMGLLPNEKIGELFSSYLNHYFDFYYSAFEDLEGPLGSRGSIWKTSVLETPVVYINPPFDACIIREIIGRVNGWLREAERRGEKLEINLTLPYWEDMEELKSLGKHDNCVEGKIIRKNDTRFIDYENGKVIRPCDIYQVKLRVNGK